MGLRPTFQSARSSCVPLHGNVASIDGIPPNVIAADAIRNMPGSLSGHAGEPRVFLG